MALFCRNVKLFRPCSQWNISSLQERINSHGLVKIRAFHDSNDRYKLIPNLMDFPVPTTPRFTNTIRNFIFSNFIIKPYYDNEFDKSNFLEGAKSAVEFISQSLSEGDFETLEESDTVSEECLRKLKISVALFTQLQRERLFVSQKDIFYNFIYQIGVILDDEDPKKRHVEITYVAHTIPNLDEMMDSPKLSFDDIKKAGIEHDTGPIVLACRFIRNYSKGSVSDSWTLNAINYSVIKDKASNH